MAKLSISKVLETRRKIRLLTVLASFLLVFMLLQGFVFNNPKKSQAAYTATNTDINISSGDYYVDKEGMLYTAEPGRPLIPQYYPVDPGEPLIPIDIDGKDLVTANGTLMFEGGERSLNSMTVGAGSKITHLGAGTDANSVRVRGDRFGAIVDGYFKADQQSLRLHNDDQVRLELYDTGPSGTIPPSSTNKLSVVYDGDRWTKVSGLIIGNWYKFNIFYMATKDGPQYLTFMEGPIGNEVGYMSIDQLDANGPSNPGLEKNLYITHFYNSDVVWLQDGDFSYFEDHIHLSTTDLSTLFNINYLVTPRLPVVPPLLNPDNYANQIVHLEWEENGFRVFDIGVDRKIDLTIVGDLVVKNGGKFDVVGRGYSGGMNTYPDNNGTSDSYGFGPGAGQPPVSGNNNASGGGHGGRGGNALSSDSLLVRGGYKNDSYVNPMLLGSGGGNAFEDDNGCIGGAGGGLIKVSARNIVLEGRLSIDASGGGAIGRLSRNKCGGGAGGTVNIIANGSFSSPAGTAKIILAQGGQGGYDGSEPGGDGGGGRVSVRATTFSGATIEDLSKGNDSYEMSFGDYVGINSIEPAINVLPGTLQLELLRNGITGEELQELNGLAERGTVYVSNSGLGNNMKKELIPIDRTDGDTSSLNSNFNPYAVRDGDVIRVRITTSNLISGIETKVKDDYLKAVSGTGATATVLKKCIPLPLTATLYHIQPGGGEEGVTELTQNADYIEWKFTSTSSEKMFEYNCKIQTP